MQGRNTLPENNFCLQQSHCSSNFFFPVEYLSWVYSFASRSCENSKYSKSILFLWSKNQTEFWPNYQLCRDLQKILTHENLEKHK